MPSYWYITADGALPPVNPQPNCKPQPYCEWYNQTVFNASTNGICQETCRDMGHMQMGFAAFLNGAMTATLQGDDLGAEQKERFFAASEFAASIVGGTRNGSDPIFCNGRTDVVNGHVIRGIKGGEAPTFEIAHKLFVRLGMDDLQTRTHLTQKHGVRDLYRKAGEFYICGPWETISHGLPIESDDGTSYSV